MNVEGDNIELINENGSSFSGAPSRIRFLHLFSICLSISYLLDSWSLGMVRCCWFRDKGLWQDLARIGSLAVRRPHVASATNTNCSMAVCTLTTMVLANPVFPKLYFLHQKQSSQFRH